MWVLWKGQMWVLLWSVVYQVGSGQLVEDLSVYVWQELFLALCDVQKREYRGLSSRHEMGTFQGGGSAES